MNFSALGRPTWAEVDLEALRWNFRQARRRAGAGRKILCVVKANAYGHGAVPCSRALVKAGADGLGVATVEEGAELRRAGLRVPVVLLGLVQPYEAAAVVRYNLQPTLSGEEVQMRALARAARSAGKRLAVHLKVDTGMGRIGVTPEEAPERARRLRKLPGLELAGIFSHLAHADGRDAGLLRRQNVRLQTAAAAIRRQSWPRALVHLANSAALLEAPDTYADMVRPGLMLYGLYPAPRFRRRAVLKPALSWKTKIIALKTVPPGTGLSYGHTYVTRRRSRIATLPVGYADGFARGLSNSGRVLVRGRSCPVVGRVCMDMTLVDVTTVPGVRLGEEVVLLGRQGRAVLGADDMARSLGTISYEILCLIGARVPRVYRGGEA